MYCWEAAPGPYYPKAWKQFQNFCLRGHLEVSYMSRRNYVMLKISHSSVVLCPIPAQYPVQRQNTLISMNSWKIAVWSSFKPERIQKGLFFDFILCTLVTPSAVQELSLMSSYIVLYNYMKGYKIHISAQNWPDKQK